MITQRAILVGFVGFCFYLIALVNGLQNYSYTLAWMAAGVLASSLALALLSLVGLECRWHVAGGRAAESFSHDQDAGPFIEVELSNAGTLNKTGVILVVRLRDERRGTLRTQRFLLEALPSGASLRTTISLSGLPRGRYRIEDLQLIGSDVLGLFRVQKRAGSEQRVVLWNDEINASSIPRLVALLQKATGCDQSTAVQLVEKAYTRGCETCFCGAEDACRATADELRRGGFRAQVMADAEAMPDAKDRALWLRIPLLSKTGFRFFGRRMSPLMRKILRRDKPIPTAAPQLVIGPAMVMGSGRRMREAAGLTGRGSETARALGQGDEFKGTRPYAPGDDLRRVHWSSSARRGSLVVREFHSPAQSRCAVIWDGAKPDSGSRRQTARSKRKMARAFPASRRLPPADSADSAAITETGLRLAASLWRALQSSGSPCGLLKLDSRPVWLAPLPVAARSTSEAEAIARVLELLADANDDRVEPLGESLRPFRADLAAVGELFLITSAPPSQWREVAARGLGAHPGTSRLTVIFVEAAPENASRSRDAPPASAQSAQFIVRAPRPDEDALIPVRAALLNVLSRASAPTDRVAAVR